jgi:hypothetical protein
MLAPAMIQNSVRQPPPPACAPPTIGPRATAPKMHMFIVIAVHLSFDAGQPVTSAGTAAISIRLVHRPCMTRPAMNNPGVHAVAASAEAITNSEA